MIAPNDTRNWQVSMDDPAAIVEGVDDIVQSINIILTTIPGSDPLRPEFGSNVYQYLDKPLPRCWEKSSTKRPRPSAGGKSASM